MLPISNRLCNVYCWDCSSSHVLNSFIAVAVVVAIFFININKQYFVQKNKIGRFVRIGSTIAFIFINIDSLL
jgi:hypothetical protein